MEKEMLRDGQTVENKLNRKLYLVQGNTLVEDVSEDSERNSDVIQLNADVDMACFRLIKDPTEDTYDFENGKFIVNGKVVATGCIKIKRILATGKFGCLLETVTLEPIKESETVTDSLPSDLYIYNAKADGYKGLFCRKVTGLNIVEMKDVGDNIVFVTERMRKEQEPFRPDNEVKTVPDTVIVVWNKTTNVFRCTDCFDYIGKIVDVQESYNGNYDVTFATNKTEKLGFLDGDVCNINTSLVTKTGEFIREISCKMNGSFVSAKRYNKEFTYKTSKEIRISNGFYINDKEIVSHLCGYDYLVDVKRSEDTGSIILTFANTKYETRKAKINNTCDRGLLYEII